MIQNKNKRLLSNSNFLKCRFNYSVFLFFIVSVLFEFSVHSQTCDQFSGQFIDENGEGVSNVQIYTDRCEAGTISNKTGFFQIRIKDNCDYLIISHVNFEVDTIDLSKVENCHNVIQLKQKVIELHEFDVLPSSKSILFSALERLQNRFDNVEEPINFSFRSLVKEDDRYVQIAEALIQTDPINPFSTYKTPKTYVLSSWISYDFSISDKYHSVTPFDNFQSFGLRLDSNSYTIGYDSVSESVLSVLLKHKENKRLNTTFYIDRSSKEIARIVKTMPDSFSYVRKPNKLEIDSAIYIEIDLQVSTQTKGYPFYYCRISGGYLRSRIDSNFTVFIEYTAEVQYSGSESIRNINKKRLKPGKEIMSLDQGFDKEVWLKYNQLLPPIDTLKLKADLEADGVELQEQFEDSKTIFSPKD